MADISRRRHFVIEGFTDTEAYKPPSGGPDRAAVPARDRESHGGRLLQQLNALKAPPNAPPSAAPNEEPEEGLDLQVEFESFPDVELAFESLAREASGIELLNVRHDGDRTLAAVFVPAGGLARFESLIRDYLGRKRDKRGRAIDNQRLIDAIHEIRRAGAQALWTDESNVFPTTRSEVIWWESWLAVRGQRREMLASFREEAALRGIVVSAGELHFPERIIVLVRASLAQLESSILMLNSIAELRRAKETADLFDTMPLDEQIQWIDELLSRAAQVGSDANAPHVCLLDTGVNRGHPLLESALAASDLHSVEPGWGTSDGHGHGTQMAGLALWGDLTPAIATDSEIEVGHRLESVKLLPTDGANAGDAHHHGYLTVEAVARPEIVMPGRSRVFGMAVTARDRRDRGRPTAWSSAVDRLASDADGNGANRRLMVLSAGNIDDPYAWSQYPQSSDTDSIQDPGQAWNALTVGAYTNLVTITDEGLADPIAPAGGLSPFSATSFTWEKHWPLKPDVVFEGGNAAKDSLGAVWTQSLSLLTTHHLPAEALLTTARATSAAMAQATRMAAQIMGSYPALWPETIRGLIVHSAEWTLGMRSQFLPQFGAPTKRHFRDLIRRCGFGVPDLERAIWTLSNSLTLVVQETMSPFKREAGKEVTARELHLHSLPWPTEVLESLAEPKVEMRVTLSYFVEPNPSARGVTSRYRYPSHGFRFDVIRPTESAATFRKRINMASREEDEEAPDSPEDEGWVVGKQNRHRGSLHSDTWQGRAADLASRGVIAVYPAGGWWKTRPRLGRYEDTARYSLLVSISVPSIDVDLCTEVASKIATIIPA